jgi:hypothetical protein
MEQLDYVTRMQLGIVTALDKLGPTYAESQMFVPQSVLWQRVSSAESGVGLDLPSDRLWTLFILSLLGKKNSAALFENREDKTSKELKWRCRAGLGESSGNWVKTDRKDRFEKGQEREQLQRTVKTLRAQIAQIENDNAKYAAANERMKRGLVPEVQKTYETFEGFQALYEQISASLRGVESTLTGFAARIPKDL